MLEYELMLKTPAALSLCASDAADPNLDDFIAGEITCAISLDRPSELMNKLDEVALMVRYGTAEPLVAEQTKRTCQLDDP